MIFKKKPIFCLVTAHMIAFTYGSSRRDIINNAPQLAEKPDWLLSCTKESPNKDDCFRRMFEGMFPNLAKGIPELGIDHFEPLIIDLVQVSKGSGSLVLTGGFKNLNIKGPSNATVSRASLDLEKKLLSFDLVIPRLRIDATYNLKGNILLLPLVGSGNVAMTMKDVKSSVYTKISIKKKPEDVIHIEEMKVTFLVGGMRIHLSNLFNGNKVLGSSLNMFLNQNANEVISELRPDLEKGLAEIFTGLWNNVFSKMPISHDYASFLIYFVELAYLKTKTLLRHVPIIFRFFLN